MLFQWLISIALTAEIVVVGMQGFVLLAQLHQADHAIIQELSELRFIVGYFKAVLHQGVEIRKNSDPRQIFAIYSSEIIRRYYLTEAVRERGFVLWVQEGEQRSEVLIHDIKLLRLEYCVKSVSKIVCQSASSIQDWHQVKAVKFYLEFFENKSVEKILRLKNHHCWQFILTVGKLET